MANNKNFVVKNGLTVGTDATIGSTLYVSTVDTTDSSAITVVPSTTFNSDVNIQNDLRVTNAIENASGNTILPAILGAADQVLSVNSAGNSASWKSISDIFGGGIDNVVDDTTPQLGGDLDLNSQDITGTGNISITGNITASGSLFVPTIDTADSSAITVVPSATFNSDVTVENNFYSNDALISNLGVSDALYVDFIRPRPSTGNNLAISGEVSFSGKVNANMFDTADSSAIVFFPAIEFESDVNIHNDLRVTNQVDATRFKGDGSLLTNLQISLHDLTDTSVGGQGTNTLLKYNGADYVPTSLVEDSSGDITASGKVKINYSSTSTPALSIESTDGTSNASPELELYKNSTSADGHYLGQIKFAGENDTGGKVNYAKITGKILDNTNGTEDGILEFAFQKGGSQNISARFRSDSLQLINGTNITVNGTSTFDDAVTVNANIIITGTVDGRDVATDGTKLDTIETNATADQTAAEILAALITVDGAGTSLDADLLDGQQGSHYLDGSNFTGTLPNNYVTLGTMTTGDYMVNVSGTANEIEITHTQAEGSTATIGLPDDVTIGNELTVTTALFTPTIDTTDSSGITVVPSTTFNSDVNIQNDLRVTNSIENASGSTLLPATLGTTNQVLTVNAAGNAAWSTISTGAFNNVVEDTTPQLGGDLDLNSQDITGTGNIDITGTVTADQLVLGDNEKIKMGTSVDLEIYHDGSHSYVDDRGTGDLRLRGNGSVKIMQYNNSEQMAAFKVNGAVELYYDNVKKFDTTSTGVDVTGDIVVSGTVDGRDVATDGTKLDGIEASATADQTAAEIKTAYESNADTNNYDDAAVTKLAGIEASATADQTASEILTAIKTVDGTGSGLDADTVDGIEAAAITQSGDSVALTGDVTGSTTVSASGEISIATTIAANSITLGTDTTGDYVATVTGTANEVEVTGSGGETAAVTVGLPSDVTVSNNLTVGGYLAGPASFTIDPAGVGDNTGTVIIAGDLQVDGTTTTINSTTVTVDDLNLTLASGSANAAAANGAGITVDGANATITYDSTNDEWDFNKNVNVSGDISVSGTINTLQVNNGNGNDAFSTAVGLDALINVNSGTLRNTAFGRSALEDNTSGERNTAIGQGAMANATTGGYNTAVGQAAMNGIVTGSSNAALGVTALESLTSGSNNMAVGRGSLTSNTTGSDNVAVGKNALFRNTTGANNVALGSTALALSSSGAVSNNVAIGNAALDGLNPGQNSNTAIGSGAGRDLNTGTENIIIGFNAEASATNMSDEITLGDDGDKSFRIPGSQFYINGGSQGTAGSNVGIGTSTPTGKVEIEEDGAVNDRLLYLNSAGGLSGGQSGPFYGLYADITANNNATEAYGAYIEAKGGTSDDTYGIWAQATQTSSTVDAIGVLGKTIVNSGSTNHGSSRALGTGPAAGVYALAETTGTGTSSQTTALHASNASTHGSLAYGAYIETISGPTTVVPLKVDHDGSEIFKLDSAGNATISGTVDGRDIATDGTKLDGIEANATADQTAAEILTAIKTVDGATSGLDADLLDGQEGSYYLDGANFTGTLPNNYVTLGTMTTGNYMVNVSGTANEIEITHTQAEGSTATIGLPDDVTIGNELTVTTALFTPIIDTTDSSAITITPAAVFSSDVTIQNDLRVNNSIENAAGQTILPSTIGSAAQVLTVNAAGTGAEWAAATGGGVSSRTEEHPTVTNGAATVTMGAAYTLAQLDVYLNGARMKSGTDYSVSSTTLTFSENLSTGDIVALYAYDTAENLITGNWSDLNDVSVTGASANAMVRYTGGNWAVGQSTEDSSGNLTVAGNITTSSGNVTVAGDVTATGSLFVPTIDTSDSSAITITPAAVFSSDVTVENDLTVSNDVTATIYYGDGSQLTGISAGATGGSTDQVFYENDQTVTTNYTISTNKNAMTAGPITVNSGVTVTIPTGSEWSIV